MFTVSATFSAPLSLNVDNDIGTAFKIAIDA